MDFFLCIVILGPLITFFIIFLLFYDMATMDFEIEKSPEQKEKEEYDEMDEFDQLINEVNNPRDFLGEPIGGMDGVRRTDEVIEKLVEIGDARAVKPLITLAKKRASFTSESAIQALGNFNNKESIDFLITLLTDKDRDIRLEAVEALDKLGWESE